jgi:hypothetical protein
MRGGRREGAGRPEGSKNKLAKALKDKLSSLAQPHGPEIIRQLVILATTSKNDAARVMACREILDRAYGKPEQAIAEEVGVEMSKELREFIERCEGIQGNEEGFVPPTARLPS